MAKKVNQKREDGYMIRALSTQGICKYVPQYNVSRMVTRKYAAFFTDKEHAIKHMKAVLGVRKRCNFKNKFSFKVIPITRIEYTVVNPVIFVNPV